MSALYADIDICPGCGWNMATSDGYCLDCAAPADAEGEVGWCEECGATVGEESLANGYCWSCGERL